MPQESVSPQQAASAKVVTEGGKRTARKSGQRRVRVGMEVLGRARLEGGQHVVEGDPIGQVVEVQADYFLLAAPSGTRYRVPFEAVQFVRGDQVELTVAADRLEQTPALERDLDPRPSP